MVRGGGRSRPRRIHPVSGHRRDINGQLEQGRAHVLLGHVACDDATVVDRPLAHRAHLGRFPLVRLNRCARRLFRLALIRPSRGHHGHKWCRDALALRECLLLLLLLPPRRRQLPPPVARHRRWRRHAIVAVAAAGGRPLRRRVVLERLGRGGRRPLRRHVVLERLGRGGGPGIAVLLRVGPGG